MPSNKNNPNEAIDPSVFASDDEAGKPAGTDLPAGGFRINFADVPDISDPLPPGKYNCTVVAAEPKISKAGNPMIALRWRVDDEGAYHKRVIFDNLVNTPNSLWHIREVLIAFGYAASFDGAINPESLIGESATLTLTIQAGNGIDPETGDPYPPRNNVKKVAPIGTSRKVADLL